MHRIQLHQLRSGGRVWAGDLSEEKEQDSVNAEMAWRGHLRGDGVAPAGQVTTVALGAHSPEVWGIPPVRA